MSRTMMDQWLPEYQVSARYSIVVRATAEQTEAALSRADFSRLPIIRHLMRLRGYRPGRETSVSEPQRSGPYGSFLQLAKIPQQEVLLGIAGRFWRPDGGMVRDLTPEQFQGFHREGYAKAVWNFLISPADGNSHLSTETRVQTFGRSATLKFRLYWTLVGPFSGLMRKAMLREVRRIAEHSAE